MEVETDARPQQDVRSAGRDESSRRAGERTLRARDLIGASTPGELDLYPFLMLVRTSLWRTLLCALLGCVLAAVYAHTRKPRYSSTASILIPQQNTGSAANAALQAATGLDLLGGGFEVYLDILRSKTVEDRLIQEYKLEDHYKIYDLSAAEGMLFQRSKMFAGKEGMVWVTVEDEDPKMAADLANAYFNELSQLNAHLGITAAGQLRRYYEAELVKEKDALADAEVALEKTQMKSGVVEPQAQASAALNAQESTRAQLRALQIQLQGLLQSETSENPDVVRLRAQIGGLESQLQAFETTGGVGVGTPVIKQSESALNFVRAQREVRFHEGLMDLLTRQYENARQQESKDISLVEVLDVARPARFADWPPSRTWMFAGFALGLLLGILWTALEGLIAVVMSNPVNRQRMHDLLRGRAIV